MEELNTLSDNQVLKDILIRTLFFEPNVWCQIEQDQMKTIVPLKRFLVTSAFTAAIAALSVNNTSANVIHQNSGVQDTILVSKALTSKKYKIRLYPNAGHNVLFFSASGEPGKVYQLFLFDLDGKLLKQSQIRNKETTVLANIVKGNYTFEIFTDDERIENGFLVIK
jgi:hypothetical protein